MYYIHLARIIHNFQIEPNYPYYTRKSPTKPTYFDLNDFDITKSSGIDPNKPIYIITHGYMESGERPWVRMRNYFSIKM